MPAWTPDPHSGPAHMSSLLYLPSNYLGVRPALGARGHHESGAHLGAHGAPQSTRPRLRCRRPRSRPGPVGALPTAPPAAVRVGAGRGLQPL